MEEPKPDFISYTDLTFQARDADESELAPLEIKASKAVLVAYSSYFKALFSEKWNKKELEEIEITTHNRQLFSILIASLHNQNILKTIRTIGSCKEQLSLLIMCSEFGITLPFIELLQIMEIPQNCFSLLIELLNSLKYNITGFTDLIVMKISNLDDIELLNNEDLCYKVRKFLTHRIVSTDGTLINIWDSLVSKEFRVLEGHKAEVLMLDISPDEKFIASSDEESTIIIWDTSSGKLLRTMKIGTKAAAINALSFSPDSQLLAYGGDNGIMTVCDVHSGEVVVQLSEKQRLSIFCAVFSPDGKYVIFGTFSGEIKILEISTGQVIRVIKVSKNKFRSIINLDVSPDGKLIAAKVRIEGIQIWNFSGELLKSLYSGHVNEAPLYFTPDGKYLITDYVNDTIKIISTSTWELVRTLEGHKNYITSLSISPDGQLIVSGSTEDVIKVWNFDTGKLIKTLGDNLSTKSVAVY